MKDNTSEKTLKKAVLDLRGASCPSCVYTIEHLGRKVEGVQEVFVDAGKSEIHVRYGGNPGSLERIKQIVSSIGYEAKIRWDSVGQV
jgi:copper chaperone CopZ